VNSKIPYLKQGDLISIVAPAKAIEPSLVMEAKSLLESKGFRVQVGEYCMGNYNYFAGTDEERASDFQEAIDNPDVRAIICARGGYGCIRILDLIKWNALIKNPKWIVGFSDITVIHHRLSKFGLKSIHGTMPLNFAENTNEAIDSLIDALKGNPSNFILDGGEKNKVGHAKGKLIGGNLSIIYSLLGTSDQLSFENSILFIEDLSEQLYHVDRMFYALQKAGILDQIKGLIVGGFTEMKDTEIPFGSSIYDLILDHCEKKKIPVCFHFPAGHINDNRSLVLGSEVEFIVEKDKVMLNYTI
jgi:muramoyltetrapeptide carboxypeptidase